MRADNSWAVISLIIVAMLNCCSCSGGRDHAAGCVDPVSYSSQTPTVLQGLDNSVPGAGIDADTYNELRSALRRCLVEKGLSNVKPPRGQANQITDLHFVQNNGYTTLEWSYLCMGDYDQNGEVNIGDLVPLARKLGKKGEFEFSSLEAVLDGDGNGEINTSDVTPIGQNFRTKISTFNIYMSSNPGDCPDEPDIPNGIGAQLVGMLPPAIGLRATEGRSRVQFPMQNMQAGMLYWVRPACDGVVGASSTPVMSEQLGWPMDGHDPRKTRQSSATGPSGEHLKWTFATNGQGFEFGQAVAGPHGVVYAKAYQDLVAINSDGSVRWKYNLGVVSNTQPVVGADGTVYTEAANSIYAFNPDGSIRWQHNSVWKQLSKPALSPHGIIYAGAGEGYIFALDGSGNMIWYKPFDPANLTSLIAIGTDGSIIGGEGNSVKAYHPSGVFYWDYYIGGKLQAAPAVSGDGTVYACSGGGMVAALDAAGNELWTYDTEMVCLRSPVVLDDGTVCITGQSGYITQLDATGQLVASFTSGAAALTTPWVFHDGSCYFNTQSPNSGITAYGVDGSYKWHCEFPSGPMDLAFTHGGDLLASGNAKVYNITSNGTIQWEQAGGGPIRCSPSVAADGTVVFGAEDGKLYAVNPNGTEKWSYVHNSIVWVPPAIAADGSVYFITDDNQLIALDSNGVPRWIFNADVSGSVSPTIGADGTVYAVGQKFIYAINPDGSVKWHHELDSGYYYSSPVIDHDGSICVIANRHGVEIRYFSMDGTLLNTTGHGSTIHQIAVTAGNMLIGTDQTEQLVMIDKTAGIETIGSFLTIGTVAPSITPEGNIYLSDVGTTPTRLVALAPDGQPIWDQTCSDVKFTAPAIDANANIYYGSEHCPLIAMDSRGNELWRASFNQYSPTNPVIGPDGTVYVACYNGQLYAFGHGE